MAIRLDNRFGDYLLFRKLGSSPLGTTFRAGRLQARAIDRVVLLQRFDGDAIDRRRLAEDAADRAGVVGALTAPHFAHGLGAGCEDGVPWVAYDYLLGRSLKETLERATALGTPPRASYLLALIEQTATTLLAASHLRVDGLPIRHGFLVPELLLLSAEGRVYPLAFSHGAALLRQPQLREVFAPYLAPESRGEQAAPGDDVYSLAAILFEGLTGAPPDPRENTALQVDRSLLTVGDEPLAPALLDLLKRALAPAGARPDLRNFRRLLRRVVNAGADSPSQFQLAFFLHQLFRDQLETEAVEMQGEKTTRFDPLVLRSPEAETASAPAAAPAEAPAARQPAVTAAAPDSPPAVAADPPPTPPDLPARLRHRPFVSGFALALLLAAGSCGVLDLVRKAPPAAAAAEGDQAVPTEAALRRLVAAGAADLERRLAEEYEPRLGRLRRELAAAREAAPGRRPAAPAAAAPAPAATEDAEPPAPARVAAREPPDQPETGAASPPPAAADRTRTVAPPAGGGEEPAAPVATPPAVADDEPLAAQPPAAPARALADAVAVEVDAPGGTTTGGDSGGKEPAATGGVAAAGAPREAAAEGDEPTAPTGAEATGDRPTAFSPPRLLEPPRPRYPAAAQRLRKVARVQVRVLVDADGTVGGSELVSDPAGFGFDKSALEAAERTRWAPARRDGVATSAWALLTIDFRL